MLIRLVYDIYGGSSDNHVKSDLILNILKVPELRTFLARKDL